MHYFEVLLSGLIFFLIDTLISEDHTTSNLKRGGGNPHIILICT